jgi:quercetin dioxygenase-like cupin family protein
MTPFELAWQQSNRRNYKEAGYWISFLFCIARRNLNMLGDAEKGEKLMNLRIGAAIIAVALTASATASTAKSASQKLPDAITADSKHYKVEFENDIVRVLRVRLDAGDSTPRHAHSAYCAIELSDSSLKEGDGPTSESKAGQVFCGDATSHAPKNVGKALAESIVVEFKNRQNAR